MSRLPEISLAHPISLITAVFTPWIAAGIGLLICFFACYLTALSWADLTYVLPTTAFGYVVIALLGRFWLHEYISPYRWAGILLITLGVVSIRKGHWVMFILGLFVPLFWLIGALMPSRARMA